MSRRYAFYLLVLGAVWGSSYLFIKVGVRDLSPAVLIEIRLLAAAPVMVAFAVQRDGRQALRAAWRESLVLGVLNAAVPFTLIAWGETYVDSGVAAVANSSVPIFLALLAYYFVPSERSTGLRLVGVCLGLVGVAVLAGVHPAGGWKGALGTGAIVVASVSYAASNLYAGRRMSVGGPVLAAGAVVVAAIVLVPFVLASLPSHAPGWKSVGSGVVLGLAGTAFALLYGAVFLHEPLTAQKLGGLALILGGVALGAGVLRLRSRAVVA